VGFPATQLLGLRSFAHGITNQIFAALIQGFILLFVLLLFFIILRRERLAAFALWFIMAIALSLTLETAIGIPFACVSALLLMWVLYRHGLLALISAIFFLHLMIFYPITSDLSAWYAADFVLALIICLALAGFSFTSHWRASRSFGARCRRIHDHRHKHFLVGTVALDRRTRFRRREYVRLCYGRLW
jgi:hypothetical protein